MPLLIPTVHCPNPTMAHRRHRPKKSSNYYLLLRNVFSLLEPIHPAGRDHDHLNQPFQALFATRPTKKSMLLWVSEKPQSARSVRTFLSSSADEADVTAERKFTASQLDGQRSRLSIPTAPLSSTYFCMSSIVMMPSALKSRAWSVVLRQDSWLSIVRQKSNSQE